MAIKLPAFRKLPPFFSCVYTHKNEMFLCRGEDTVLGLELGQSEFTCTDIGMYPLHDTYGDYPAVPSLEKDKAVQERFYYALTGWVGRNPFLNHILGNDLIEVKERQRKHLEIGLKALAKYTSNPRYETVLGNFDESFNSAERYIKEFKQAKEAWQTLTDKIFS